jgi:alpha-tubulin suppressor-like RCC1 family protein
MIPIKTVVDKANTKITAGSLTDLEYTQLSSTDVFLDRTGPEVVANFVSLPSAANNEGIMYYVTNENVYYFSDGTYWRKDFSSSLGTVSTIMYAWGSGGSGKLGDNTVAAKSSPVTVVGGITNWSQISNSNYHTLGLTSAGILYAWGSNSGGRLGDNTTSSRSSPVTPVGGINTWRQIAAGGGHSFGITSDGILYAWGLGSYGRLGDNTTSSRLSPVTVVGGITNWTQVTAGDRHALGLRSTGVLYAWGYGYAGRLGNNASADRSSPVTVVGGITSWSQISTGEGHNLGFTSGGIAYAWGGNGNGQLGDNTITARSSPVTVVGGITTWSQLSGGRFHSMGLTSAGVAYAWGYNAQGRLGDNTVAAKSSPVTVVGGITNWSRLTAGRAHSFGRTSAGILYAWGENTDGQLGDGTTSSRSSPVTAVGGITSWSQLSTGQGNMSAALVSTGTKGFV